MLRVADVLNDSIVDGPGLRLVVFAQGCPHHCPGCHNPQTHDPRGGRDMAVDDIARMMDKNPLLSGVTLTGGDPFMQPSACAEVAREARKRGLSVIAYTGYTWEQLMGKDDKNVAELVSLCDYIVDGRFELKLRSLELRFRGSSNQRFIDVAKSLKSRGKRAVTVETL